MSRHGEREPLNIVDEGKATSGGRVQDMLRDVVPSGPPTMWSLFATRLSEAPADRFVVSAESGTVYSYADMETRVIAIEAQLGEIGVEAGDHIAWVSEPSTDGLAIWLALDRLGAIDICLGNALRGPVLVDMVRLTQPRAVIVTGSTSHIADELRKQMGQHSPHIITLSEGYSQAVGARRRQGMSTESDRESVRRTPVSPYGLSTLMFTSGTTGPSKAVMLSKYQLVFAAYMFGESFNISEDSALYSYSPMNHLTGRQLSLASLLTGAPLILRRAFHPEAFWEDTSKFGCSHAVMVGAAVPLLLQTLPNASDQETLRHIWAVPAMPHEHDQLARRLGAAIYVPYGTTEVGIVTTPDPSGVSTRPGQCGQVRGPYAIAILDEVGREVSTGVVGEIAVRPKVANSTFLGYWRDDAATVEATRGLWYHTQDLGSVDSDGYLYFADRRDGFIRSRGENISSAEVASVIRGHEQIADCAVIGVDSELGDSDLYLFIVAGTRAPDPNALFQWCCRHLPHYMVPRYIASVSALPLTESGKVKRYELRQLVEQGSVNAWDARQAGLRATRNGVAREPKVIREGQARKLPNRGPE